ncbi:MAG: urease accessory UreF family protein [Pseudomonadota bacterium]
MSTGTSALPASGAGQSDGIGGRALGARSWTFWRLISAALPVGAFHYSQGLETAVARDAITDRASAQDWLLGVLRHGIGSLDLPLIDRVMRASARNDLDAVHRWDDRSIAYRETAELRREELDMGAALVRWAAATQADLPRGIASYAACFGVLAERTGIDRDAALAGYAWAWLENITLAATKLVPLGHLEAQAMLTQVAGDIEAVVAAARALGDEELGANTVGLLLMSAAHESQPSRLFRS